MDAEEEVAERKPRPDTEKIRRDRQEREEFQASMQAYMEIVHEYDTHWRNRVDLMDKVV